MKFGLPMGAKTRLPPLLLLSQIRFPLQFRSLARRLLSLGAEEVSGAGEIVVFVVTEEVPEEAAKITRVSLTKTRIQIIKIKM